MRSTVFWVVFILRLVVSVSPLCNVSHQERFRSSDSFRSMLMFPILHLMESVFQDSRPFPRKRLPYGLEVLSHGFSREISCFSWISLGEDFSSLGIDLDAFSISVQFGGWVCRLFD